jgi:S-adenosylmethionine-diacylgycerolhomoserine-N-methlytransferase
LTRPFFLHGRQDTVSEIIHYLSCTAPAEQAEQKILEVGCGTGFIEQSLRNKGYDGWYLGIDVSQEMLQGAKSANRKSLFMMADGQQAKSEFDVVVMSYLLTLTEDWKDLLSGLGQNLKAEGMLAVVDFHKTDSTFYSKYMDLHKVSMGVNIIEYLNKIYECKSFRSRRSKLGLWEYFKGLWIKKK